MSVLGKRLNHRVVMLEERGGVYKERKWRVENGRHGLFILAQPVCVTTHVCDSKHKHKHKHTARLAYPHT